MQIDGVFAPGALDRPYCRDAASPHQTVSERLAVSFPTASAALDILAKIGVVREITGRRRSRIYAYSDYLALLDRGAEPLPA